MEEEKYLRPKEACKILGISSRTLYEWEKEGKVECARTRGGHRRILKTDVLPDYKSTPRRRQKKNLLLPRLHSFPGRSGQASQILQKKNALPAVV